MPVRVTPSALAVRTTCRSVAPVSRVTVILEPAVIVSEAVAVIVIELPNLYVPFVLEEESAVIVGLVMSRYVVPPTTSAASK